MSDRPASDAQNLSVVATVIFGLAGSAWAAALLVWLQPLYRSMFRDFSTVLPPATAACLAPWFPALAALPALAAGATLSRQVPRDARALLLLTAALVGVAHAALFFVAMYLPIFSLASAIK